MKPIDAVDTVTMLFSHNLWANVGILECCAGLTDAQLDTTISGVYGTIRDTLQHIVTSERSYFWRIKTGQPFRRPADEPPLTMAELMESVRTTGTGLIEWAPKVQANETVKVNWDDGTVVDVPKALILTQAINHATEHRAQIMAMLTQLGIKPPELGGWPYFETLKD